MGLSPRSNLLDELAVWIGILVVGAIIAFAGVVIVHFVVKFW